jgi:hypothetical protein
MELNLNAADGQSFSNRSDSVLRPTLATSFPLRIPAQRRLLSQPERDTAGASCAVAIEAECEQSSNADYSTEARFRGRADSPNLPDGDRPKRHTKMGPLAEKRPHQADVQISEDVRVRSA